MYGVTPSQPQSQEQTQELFQAALHAQDQIRLPSIIAGDFNLQPFETSFSDWFTDRQMVDLCHLHRVRYGTDMRPTCNDTTNPDNALFTPDIASWVTDIHVHAQGLFDTHHVPTFTLKIPFKQHMMRTLVMPSSWIDLAIEQDYIHESYTVVCSQEPTPDSLETWANQVEHAVDLAYRKTQQRDFGCSWNRTTGLPRKYRGRCKPRAPVLQARKLLTRMGRLGDYQPCSEIVRFATAHQVRQARRVKSLLGLLSKAANQQPSRPPPACAWPEWQAILSSGGYGHSFSQWCANFPEIGPLPPGLPDCQQLDVILQLVVHHANIAVAEDARIRTQRCKYERYLDKTARGNSKAYKGLKNKGNTMLTELRQDVQDQGICVPQRDGVIQVFCAKPQAFDMHTHVMVNQHPCVPVELDEHSITVRPMQPDCSLPEETEVTQSSRLISATAIFSSLNEVWDPYWNQTDMPVSDQLQEFVDLLPTPSQPIQVRVDEVDLWCQAVQSHKPHSARGIDAIAASELQTLPREAIGHLAHLLNSFSSGFEDWFMQARTVPVPKVDAAPQPTQVRPITILAQLYRTWARVISSQLIDYFSGTLPTWLTGFLRNRGPMDACYVQSTLIEQAHSFGTSASGFSVDLVKCFNTMCRRSVAVVLAKMGVPQFVLAIWMGSLQRLRRFWVLGSDCSALLSTNHGCPEGDTMSVIAMLGLSYAWLTRLHHDVPSAVGWAYADNWSWATAWVDDHLPVLTLTTRFIDATRMRLDWAKTWSWSVEPGHQAVIANIVGHFQSKVIVPHCRSAMDLGCQFNYRGTPVLGGIRGRLQTAHTRLARLQVLPHDIRTKAFLVMGGIYTVGFYGAELVPVGTQHFKAMRVQVAQAIHGPSSSRNSAISVACTPHVLDPLVFVLVRCLRSAQRYLTRSLPSERQVFYDMAAKHSGQSSQCHGPAGTLTYYLCKIGWSLNRTGDLLTDQNLILPLLTTSIRTLQVWVERAWLRDMLLHECTRRATTYLTIDVLSTVQVLNALTPQQQHHVIQEIAGAFQPGVQQAKWAQDSQGLCPFCQAEDTKEHRMYDCVATEHVRAPFQPLLSRLRENGSLAHEMPVIFLHEDVIPLQVIHAHHVEAQLARHHLDKLRALQNEGVVPQFFTDGSLKFPQDKVSRHASYAIVLDTCLSDEDRIFWGTAHQGPSPPPTFVPLAVARTTGNQSVFRSELYAILKVMEWTDSASIVTDSSAAIRTFSRCRDAPNLLALADLSERDLVIRMWQAHQRGTFSIQKVKSHTDPMSIADPLLRYLTWGNMVADSYAVEASQTLCADLVKTAMALHAQLEVEKRDLGQVYDLQLQLQKHRAILAAAQERHELAEQASNSMALQRAKLRGWTILAPWQRPASMIDRTMMVAWGPLWAQVFKQWATGLKWPVWDQVADGDPGVAFFELALSLCYFSGLPLPCRRAAADGEVFLVQPADTAECQAMALHLGDLGDNFTILAQQMEHLSGAPFFPDYPRKKCKGPYWLGARAQMYGILGRPEFPCQREVIAEACRLAKQPGPTFTQQVPMFSDAAGIEGGFLSDKLQQVRDDLRDPWLRRRRRAQKVSNEVRAAVRSSDRSAGDIRAYFRGGG
eukprot:Skav218600  [mRNA]  locus=scaffold3628:123125:127939:+ [translate_table: standard]